MASTDKPVYKEADFAAKILKSFSCKHVAVLDTTGSTSCNGQKFEVYIGSSKFDGMKLLERHRLVQDLLAQEFKHLHSLSLKCWTEAEWDSRKDQVPAGATDYAASAAAPSSSS